MAVTYSTTVKNTRLSAVVTALGNGAKLVIGSAGSAGGSITTALATIVLNSTPATVASGVLTFSGLPLSDVADATGTANSARLEDSSGTVIASGLTVGTSGADIIISSTAVTSGQTVTLTSGTITHG